MSVEEIKDQLAALPQKDRDAIAAFLFALRRREDESYQDTLSARLEDSDESHWLTPDEFERELDARES